MWKMYGFHTKAQVSGVSGVVGLGGFAEKGFRLGLSMERKYMDFIITLPGNPITQIF